MKENEFIELLNLYLDHEISEADAARLEAEVQRNPARYRIYREYCQMQKACALLSPAAASEVPATATFEAPSRRWAQPFAVGGFLAAAACATFLFLNRAPTVTPVTKGSPIAAETPAIVSPTRADVPATASSALGNSGQLVSISLGRSDFQPPLATQTLRWNPNNLVGVPTAPDARLNWIETLELSSIPPVPADSLRFETKAISKDGPRTFGPGQLEAPMEYNAIQFSR